MPKKKSEINPSQISESANVPLVRSLPPQNFTTAGEAVNFRDSWRIFRIISEFIDGYQFLSKFKKEVTILGSARLPKNGHYYKVAEELGWLLGKNGFTTITGGGPGIMEATNKGAFEAGGTTVGINIQLPFEQRINPYVKESVGFFYFFTRKVMLTSPADAFVFFPGGFGTMDEFFEVVDFMELGFMQKVPVVLVGKEFWEPLLKFLRLNSSGIAHSISEDIIDSWHLVDTAEDAYEFIKNVEDAPSECAVSSDNIYCQGGSDWRVFRIMAELVDGFEFLTKLKNDVTIFGTKSILPGSSYYNVAYEVGKLLAKNGFTTITGGGPGVMEAANKGAFEAGGESVGINMRWEKGERVNNYVTKSAGFFFPFVRKLIITAPSKAFVFFPGGFGTLHQLFELLTLQETKKSPVVPIILVGSDFWKPMLEYFHILYHDFKTIGLTDQDLVKVVDRADDVLKYIK
ncbi:MAG: TIGR00730 family Rossman fold protein [Candidatus Magasanikbacteria bacterium]